MTLHGVTLSTIMVPSEKMAGNQTETFTGNDSSNSSVFSQGTLGVATLELARWATPITVTLGLLGNLLTFLVMTRKKNRRISCCVYMAVLAVTDSYTLFSYMGFNVCLFYNDNGLCMNQTLCSVGGYLMGTTSVSGTMLLVTLTIDRFMAVRFPLKARVYCTPKRARIISFIVIVCCFFYNIPHIRFSGFLQSPYGPVCFLVYDSGHVFSGLNIVIIVVIPFLILLVLNTMIIRVIQERGKYFTEQETGEQNGGQDERRRSSAPPSTLRTHSGGRTGSCGDIIEEVSRKKERDKQLTRMLLFVTFAYVLLTAPQYIRQTTHLFISDDVSQHQVFLFFTCLFQRLYFTNYAINFYLYFFTGSKFRLDLFKMLCCVGESRSPDLTDSQLPNIQINNTTSVLGDQFLTRPASMASNLNLAQSTQNLRTRFVRQMSENNGASPWQNLKSFMGVVKVVNGRPSSVPAAARVSRIASATNLSPRIELDANPIDVLLECQRRRSRAILEVPPLGAFSVSMTRLTSQMTSDVIEESAEGERREESVITSHQVINIIRATSQELGQGQEEAPADEGHRRAASVEKELTRTVRFSRSVRSSRSSGGSRLIETTKIVQEENSTLLSAPDSEGFPEIAIDPSEEDVFPLHADPLLDSTVAPCGGLTLPPDLPSGGMNLQGLSMDNLLSSAQARTPFASLATPGVRTELRRSVSERNVCSWRVPEAEVTGAP